MARPKKLLTEKQNKMLRLIKLNSCNISKSCKALKISRQTHYDWLDTSYTYKKEFEEATEGVIDFVESALMKQIKNGNTASIIFFLKTRGRSRGYSEQPIMNNDDICEGFDVETII